MSRSGVLLLTIAASALGCASAPGTAPRPAARLAVITPFDGIPVRAADALAPAASLEQARAATLVGLRGDLAAALRAKGIDVVELDSSTAAGGRPPAPAEIAALGRAAGVDEVVAVHLLAYGDIRRSWLWVLAAQGFVAGVGHGVAVTAATGNPTLGWWAGAGEFALETVTWVGGAVVGGRAIDPVLVRVRLVRTADGAVIRHWTREGTRPLRQWLHRRDRPPRAERLRTVADHVFEKLAPRLARNLEPPAAPAHAQLPAPR